MEELIFVAPLTIQTARFIQEKKELHFSNLWRRYVIQKFFNLRKFIFFLLSNYYYKFYLIEKSKSIIDFYNQLTPVQFYSLCACFISNSFTIKQKLTTLIYHHGMVENRFRPVSFLQLIDEGITCYSETIPSGKIEVTLKVNRYFFNEGALSLILSLDRKIIFWMFFTIAPKTLLKSEEETIIISCVQLKGKNFDEARAITKELKEIAPSKLLLYCLEGIARALNVGKILGIRTTDHILYKRMEDAESFNKNYNEFWENIRGCEKRNLGYVIPLPLQHKPIEEIKQNHRSRAIVKQNKLDEISKAVTRQTNMHLLPVK